MTSRSGESNDAGLQSKVEQQQERIDELEQTVKKMMPSRRDMLKGGAAAGAGLLGFGAGQASADGHNDGDTQWGSNSNRDDYLVDHLDAISVNADRLIHNVGNADLQPVARGLIGVRGPGLDMTDYVDPSNHDNPVNEAQLRVSNALAGASGDVHGAILTPPDLTHATAGVEQLQDVNWYTPFGKTRVDVPADVDGWLFDSTNDPNKSDNFYVNMRFGNVVINGPGEGTATSGYGVHFVDGIRRCHFGGVEVRNWSNVAWLEDSGSSSFENHIESIALLGIDAGDKDAIFVSNSGGAPNSIGLLAFNAGDSRTGSDSTGIRARTGDLTGIIGTINAGGTIGRLANAGGAINIGTINYEPGSGQNSTPTDVLFLTGGGPGVVGQLNVFGSNATVGYGASANSSGWHIGPVKATNGATINNSPYRITSDPGGDTLTVWGQASQVDNVTGASLTSPGVACLGSLEMKTSTGTGP